MENAHGGCSEERLKVRCLVMDSLLPLSALTKPSSIMTKEAERSILLTLTSVLREVRQCTFQVRDLHLDQAVGGNPIFGSEHDIKCDGASGVGCDCLEEVLALLISFFIVDNMYVKHLAGKIVVETFEFLVKSGGMCWKDFLYLLWIGFEASFHIIALTSNSSQSESVAIAKGRPLLSSVFMDTTQITNKFVLSMVKFLALFRSHPVNDKLCLTIPLIKALRDMLKLIKMKHGDLLRTCVELYISHLSAYPLNLRKSSQKTGIFGGELGCAPVETNPFPEKARCTQSDSLLNAMLLQLLCSIVDDKNPGVAILNDYSIYCGSMKLAQDILSFGINAGKEYTPVGLLQYLRHKALILMIRLSVGVHWKCSYIMSWMWLLKMNFDDLLDLPLGKHESKANNALEGSPFLPSFIQKEKVENMCSCHLQRQAVFLFLKCCFASSYFSSEPGCVDWAEMHNVCSRELHNWLTKHITMVESIEYDTDSPSCSKLSLSLLQLFLDEDDLLFELLLLVMDAAYVDVAQDENIDYNGPFFMGMRRDIVPCLSSIFNPIHLFHFFLYLLHYDHMVLLDYLISKDTGIQCLQYLMRCLHSICRSWSIFMKFSLSTLKSKQVDSLGKCLPVERVTDHCTSFLHGDTDSCFMMKKMNKKSGNVDRKRQKTGHSTFENARNCLLCLGTSIEDLHRKNLFPYNPAALLKRFSRFQTLCLSVN